jgi:hypothetical protein
LRSLELLSNGRAKRSDFAADCRSQGREGGDDRNRNQSCGDCIFRQLKTCFIAKEIPNHFFAPLVWLLLMVRLPSSALKESARGVPVTLTM